MGFACQGSICCAFRDAHQFDIQKKPFLKLSLWTVSPCFGFGDFQKERGQTLRGFGVTVEELSAFDVSYSFCEN